MGSPTRHLRALLPAAVALAIAASIGAPPARADDPKPGSKKNGGFTFSPPEPDPAEPGATAPATPGAPGHKATDAPDANDPLAVAIRALSTWPGQDGIRAAETLLLRGTDSVPYLIRALRASDASVMPGAAWVLGKLGQDATNAVVILQAAALRQSGSRLEVFFEAANQIDAVVTKKWLFSFLGVLQRPVFRARATDFLATILGPDDRPKIDELLASRQGGIKIAGLTLLAKLKAPDAIDRLVDSLSDIDPEVAYRTTQLLGSTGDETLLPRLNTLAKQGDMRQRSYSILTLVEFCRSLRRNVFEPATIAEMIGRRGLANPAEKLARGAAAVGLVYGGLDGADKTVGPLLDGIVVDTLVDTVAGDHFRDFASLTEPVFAALRRLSGIDLPSSANRWTSWWGEQRGTFRARRLLTAVADEDVPHARVVFDSVDSEGRRRHVVFTADGGDGVEGAYVLPAAAFSALLAGVEDAGLFKNPDDQRTMADEHLAVRVGVMNQEKRMLLAPSREDARFSTLSARVEALEEANLWQKYQDTDEFPDPVAWRRHQAEVFASVDGEGRKTALRHAVVFSFDDLPTDAAKSEALDVLERIGGEMVDAEANHLLATATQAPAMGPVEVRALGLVAALRRPELRDSLIEALSVATSPAASEMLATSLADSGPLRVREAFADPRPPVRAAGAAAALSLVASLAKDATAKARIAEAFGGGLRALLSDPDLHVQVRAAATLAVMGDAEALPKLSTLFEDGDASVRIEVAQALGRIGGAEVHPLLIRMVDVDGDGAAPIRAAALRGLASSNHPNAVKLLAHFLLNDADPSVQDAARDALIALGTEEARFALVDLLTSGTILSERRERIVRTLAGFSGMVVRETLGRFLEDPNVGVVTEAALGLAKQNEGVAVPYLIAILKRTGDPVRPKALEALEEVTSLTLAVTGFDAAAEQYAQWHTLHREGGDRAWFRDAIARRGYDGNALSGYVHGDADLKAVPTLLRTIRDDDAVVRRNSNVALERISGKTFGVVERHTPREQTLAVADRWSQWWTRLDPKARPPGR